MDREESRAGRPYEIEGRWDMLEYAFEEIPCGRGFFVGRSKGRQEIILRREAEGWRYRGWIPKEQMDGNVILMDLVFERKTEGQA